MRMGTTTQHRKHLQVITATLPTTILTLPLPTTTKRKSHIPAPATRNSAPAMSHHAPAISHLTPTLATRLTHTMTLQPKRLVQLTITEPPEPKSTPRTLPSLTTPKPRQLAPYKPAAGQQFWCKELDGSWTLRTHSDIVMGELSPGHWEMAKTGYHYWVRSSSS